MIATRRGRCLWSAMASAVQPRLVSLSHPTAVYTNILYLSGILCGPEPLVKNASVHNYIRSFFFFRSVFWILLVFTSPPSPLFISRFSQYLGIYIYIYYMFTAGYYTQVAAGAPVSSLYPMQFQILCVILLYIFIYGQCKYAYSVEWINIFFPILTIYTRRYYGRSHIL